MTVWVEGATGKAGRRVVEALAAAGVPVRAAGRHPGEPSPGVTPVLFDWHDQTTWEPALGDADTLFLKGLDSDPHADRLFARLIASAPRARRVVFMSVAAVGRTPADTPRRAVELAVQHSGRAWTILRPSWLLQNFDEDEWVFARALREDCELYASSGDGLVGFVDARDVAAAAVAVLTEDGHDGRCYTITGPEAITFGRVAEVLATASGRLIRHVPATVPQHRAYFARSGRPDAWIDHMLHLFEEVRTGVYATVTDDLHRLTGNPPRGLEAYAKEVWAR
ncbi:NAD(P)H-binding protein [Actinoallomurus sp. CA-150999]|uniref:NAD(P)H-binding protein n=1 Tax=Actinoallomurus sp. CA-150999 TaxID=3239887 RepID=UPI003D93F519